MMKGDGVCSQCFCPFPCPVEQQGSGLHPTLALPGYSLSSTGILPLAVISHWLANVLGSFSLKIDPWEVFLFSYSLSILPLPPCLNVVSTLSLIFLVRTLYPQIAASVLFPLSPPGMSPFMEAHLICYMYNCVPACVFLTDSFSKSWLCPSLGLWP